MQIRSACRERKSPLLVTNLGSRIRSLAMLSSLCLVANRLEPKSLPSPRTFCADSSDFAGSSSVSKLVCQNNRSSFVTASISLSALIPDFCCRINFQMTFSDAKFEAVKFDGTSNFGLWQIRVKDLLAQQGILKALRATKLDAMKDEDWEELQQRAAATIRLYLTDEVMYHIMKLKSPGEI